jgi:hypothetical protein
MNTTQNKKLTVTPQTVTSKEEQVMETRINRRTLGNVLGGAITVCLAGATLTVADSDASGRAPAVSVDQSEIAAWADANGLTGLSPASLTSAPNPPASVDQTDIAAWAIANDLTGLSPASLRRIED